MPKDQTETGLKWWVKYVFVPIIVAVIGGGLLLPDKPIKTTVLELLNPTLQTEGPKIYDDPCTGRWQDEPLHLECPD